MAALTLTVCYDTGDLRSLSHGAVTGGPFEQFQTLTGGTSGATAEIVGVNASSVEVMMLGGEFENGETVTQSGGVNDGANAALDADPTCPASTVTLEDDQRLLETKRGKVKGADLVVDDQVRLFTDQDFFRVVSIP